LTLQDNEGLDNDGLDQCSNYPGNRGIPPHCVCNTRRRSLGASVSPHCFFLSSTTGLDIEDWSLLDWTLTDWTMTAVFCSAATSSAALPCMQQKTIRRVYLYVLKLLAVPWLRFIAYDLEHIRVSLKWQKRNGAKNGTSRV